MGAEALNSPDDWLFARLPAGEGYFAFEISGYGANNSLTYSQVGGMFGPRYPNIRINQELNAQIFPDSGGMESSSFQSLGGGGIMGRFEPNTGVTIHVTKVGATGFASVSVYGYRDRCAANE